MARQAQGLSAATDDESCVGYVAAKVIEGQFLFSGKPCPELSPEFLWNVARERDNTPYTPRSGIYDALLIATEYGAPLSGAVCYQEMRRVR